MDTKATIKAVTDTHLTVGGYGIVFGGRDLVGDQFTAETDLWADRLGTPMVLYHHGLDASVKRSVLGKLTAERVDDVGVWVEAQIELSNQYADGIRQLVQKGVLGWSSGAISHLVERDEGGTLKSWPRVEYSLTPAPCEPRTLGVTELGDVAEAIPEVKALLEAGTGAGSAPAAEATTDAIDGISDASSVKVIGGTMPDTDKAPENEAVKGLQSEITELKGQYAAVNDGLQKLLKLMEEAPGVRKAGYYTVDGGTADPEVKSFGDFLLSIQRHDTKRLSGVYKASTLVEDAGETGGYLVPTEYRSELLRVAAASSPIVGMCRTIPVSTDAGEWPALDQYVAPTAGVGDTAFAGGVTAAVTAEAGLLTETNPTFEMIKWRVNKIGGFTYVSNELINDSPQSIEALLTGLFGVAVAAKREYFVLRGNGVGVPLGILNAGCAVGISPDTNNYFGYADAFEMASRFKPVGGQGRWLMHQSVYPDIAVWEIGTAGAGVGRLADVGYGEPIFTEHLPQANSSGCVILADMSGYLLFERSGLSIAYSEHAAFTYDKGTWRFTERLDGQPWMKSYITLADPTGSFTVSPFVYFND